MGGEAGDAGMYPGRLNLFQLKIKEHPSREPGHRDPSPIPGRMTAQHVHHIEKAADYHM